MSEAATRPGSTAGASGEELLDSLGPLLAQWLPRQRWFAGKGSPVTGFGLVSVTEMLPPGSAPGLLHLLVRARQSPAGGQEASGPPGGDCYQLLLGVRQVLPPRLAPALVGRPRSGPLAGLAVYDALGDPRLAQVLLERLRTRGSLGDLHFERDPGTDIPEGLTARALGVEQSNSSLVYGEEFILKVFRRVLPGVQPDVELPLALAAAGSTRVQRPVAWFGGGGSTEGEPYVLGVLQPFLAGAEDGWELALAALAAGRDFVPEARALGRATAEVHLSLADALPSVTLGRAQTAAIADGMLGRLAAAAAAVPALQPYADGLGAVFRDLAELREGLGPAQRVHGDLHLGQCLRAPGTGHWSVVDFEGEPARPLAERRRAHPPVRDVAGMLRSFDYAARSHGDTSPDWARDCRAAYCDGYASASGQDPRAGAVLLRAYETDKAVYEVLYEARHRPDWLPVPLAAVRRLAMSG
ncbi:Maltokinase [Streptomyces sp. YIM 130001]|uniref:maltokinase N-terminal cap-like domain-containing protein n=1 Tax=Streptomyces sp. YIM 130001 TaxID=2259644 RepID=UPI000E65A638|nr:phosphotransferase [Streptomyces sp. YIM 130001]RII15687.1 Maltokinase [Streptomyces sp. YIM 130001]